jgi:hypothetical protein
MTHAGNHGTRAALAAFLAAVLVAGAARATETFGTSTTMPYVYTEQFGGKEHTFLSLYEFLDLGATAIPGAPGLSFYLAGWGRLDMAEKRDIEGNAPGDADLGSAYLEWVSDERLLDVAAGRRFVHVGPVAERLDGVQVQADPVDWLGVQLFGGVPVVSQVGERDGDWGYGGRVYGGYRPYFEVGASYAGFLEKGAFDRQRIGGDLSVFPAAWLDVLGHAYFDVLYGSLYDARATLVARPVKDLALRAEFEHAMPSATLGMGSIFSVFSFDTITRLGGEARYTAARRVALDASYQRYLYDERDPADRYGGGVAVLWGAARENQAGLGAARLAREDNGTIELRAYLAQRASFGLYGAVDAIVYLLDDRVRDVNSGIAGSASLGWSFREGMTLQATGSYRGGPYDASDVRGLVKFAYNVDRTF